MSEHPKRVNVSIRKKSGEIVSKWIQIRYDYLSKYCKTCKLQEHNKEECFVLYPELFEERKKEDLKEENNKKEEREKVTNTEGEKNIKKGNDFHEAGQRNGGTRGRGSKVLLKDGILNKRKRGWLLRISFRY